eukprot:CAMPEP_0175858876 /NCGR_PEP_ID=MMETSP0107_2-20121207/29922_1 /TAXON_ID=195067 ORGANISM="Goniomonas pacifica, Strain CCMP1869" /NCGR_SAMPLE_ID=MMETSP0107_2 /ASSEMBLY_ACC=CAM_ASM_000203 /LENGTH=287 /DNA_ID=CAMNT_0017175391 /DNA_START=345 /DNA_END=1206 /DNA_ORIENTATION=+
MSSPLIAASTPSIVIASPSSWGLTYTTATTTFSLQKTKLGVTSEVGGPFGGENMLFYQVVSTVVPSKSNATGGIPLKSLALGSTFQTPQPPCPSPTSLALSPLCLIDNHTLCLATTPPLPMSTVVIAPLQLHRRFDGSGGSQLTTTAVPLVNSTSVMVCLAPNWGAVYAAETVSVNVLYVDRVLDGNLLYTFFDMVSSIDTATTSSMGGLSLTVRGAGFNATALYKCIFVGGADSMTTDATVTSVSVAECLVPDWGAVYKAQTVNVNLLLRSPTTTTQHHTSHHHAT